MKSVVGFLSRPHGFNVLIALVNSNEYKLKMAYTHALNPKSQDPTRSTRPDYNLFVKICSENNVPLLSIDSKEQGIENFPDCDFIVEVSWRYIIPKEIINKAHIAAFGIHRGRLPDYAGAEPIKQALLKGEKEIVLSAHYLESVIDQGITICTASHPVNYDQKCSLEQNIQRLRDEITPLFSKLVFDTFKVLEAKLQK